MDNLDSMSAEDLRDALKAKDEMVKELERKISEMQEDAEASLKAESDDDKAKMAEEDDKEDDKSKMAEHDDEEKKKKMNDHYNKMSESSSLLSEVASLRETVATLTAERDASLKKQAVNALLSEGCISPAEEAVAGKAWELRDLQPEFWAFFSERKPSQAVPLNEVGHGASGEEINQQSLNERVTTTAKNEGITYSEALAKVRRENPDFYNRAFGG